MSGSPRVLVIAPHGSYRTSAFVAAARKLGVQALIASEGRHSIVSDYARGLHVDFRDPDAALATLLDAARRDGGFRGVIGTDDSSVELAAEVARALDLPHNPPAAVRLSRRKDLARECLRAAGVRVPAFVRHRFGAPRPEVPGFPLVIKPVGLSGSRGVIRVDDPAQLDAALKRVAAIAARAGHPDPEVARLCLLETFVPGPEVAVEGMLHHGQLQILTVFDKPDPLDGPFFEETYYTTPSRHPPAVLEALHAEVQAACRAFGLVEGPVHAECRINAEGVWIIELASRTIGGLCGRLLRFGTGHSLEELVLAQAMGGHLPVAPAGGGAGVLMIPIPRAGILRRVEGLLAARRVPGIESIEIQIREGHELVPLPEGSSYLGFIFARGDDPAAAEAALRAAHGHLNIVVAPLWKAAVA